MAMLQEEPVIVKPMPGRPGSQNPPRRGRGSLGFGGTGRSPDVLDIGEGRAVSNDGLCLLCGLQVL